MSFFSSQRLQTMYWVGIGIVFAWVLYTLGPILTPFLLGAILAYILNPGVDWLTSKKVPRWIASAVMIVLMTAIMVGLLLIIIPLIQKEIAAVQQQLPTWLARLNEVVSPKLREWFGIRVRFDPLSLKRLASEQWLQNSEDILAIGMTWLRSSWGVALFAIGTLLLVPVVVYYLLVDWWQIVGRVHRLVPRRWSAALVDMVKEFDEVIGQFFRGQLLVMLVLAFYYATALAIAGFDLALPIGVITGLLVFIPYVGFGLGLILAALAAVLQFPGWNGLIAVAVVYGGGQLLESFFLTPRLVGERIGLHPLAVIFALMAFGQVFGFFGVLMALPVSAVLLVALRRLQGQYMTSTFYLHTHKATAPVMQPITVPVPSTAASSAPVASTTPAHDAEQQKGAP